MKKINSIDEVKTAITGKEFVIIYVSMPLCSVCHADKPRVDKLASQYGIECIEIDGEEMAEARGYFNLFTAPVVLIYFDGREFHRQARIIDFAELEYRLAQFSQVEH